MAQKERKKKRLAVLRETRFVQRDWKLEETAFSEIHSNEKKQFYVFMEIKFQNF